MYKFLLILKIFKKLYGLFVKL